MRKTITIIAALVGIFLVSIPAASAAELKASDIADTKGDGPDKKANTADDTWQFWYQYDTRSGYGCFGTYCKQPKGVADAKNVEGWVYSMTEDWSPDFEGIWGNKSNGQMHAHPYTHHGLHASVAITYKVPEDGEYNISGGITDMFVMKKSPDGVFKKVETPDGRTIFYLPKQPKNEDGVIWVVEVVTDGKAAKGKELGRGQPIGDTNAKDSTTFKIEKAALKKGELVRFVIDPNKWWGTDMTRIDSFKVEPVGGAKSPEARPAEGPFVRVAAYNVQYGKWCKPEQVGEMFKEYNLDVVGLGEVPGGDWTARVGKVLGMQHSHVGKLSSGNPKDNKYKSILSKTPLEDMAEYDVGNGFSAVAAKTTVRGIKVSVYSLHIGGTEREACQKQIAEKVLPKDKSENIIMMGDFNAVIGKNKIKRFNLMRWLTGAGMRATWGDLGIDVEKVCTYCLTESGQLYRDSMARYGVIDHIMINGSSKLHAVEGGIIELKKPLSDHKPIWAELRPKGK